MDEKLKRFSISKLVLLMLCCSLLMSFNPLTSVGAAPTNAVDDPRIINLTISLYRDSVDEVDKEKYETIIKYFADSIYEASNTAHKIGTVTIYTGARNSRSADIVWTEECHPSSKPSGIYLPGWHINMCDVFVSSRNGTRYEFLTSHTRLQEAGFTVGHEWGHYYYSLYDEYKITSQGGDPQTSIPEMIVPFQPRNDDKPVPRSIMNNQSKALTDGYGWLNFSSKANFIKPNAQSRMYGMSAWELFGQEPLWKLLLRQKNYALPLRLRFPDLLPVTPALDKEADIDLSPGGSTEESRSDLKIIWANQVNLEIVIDQSSSMEDEKLANVIEAAKLLVDLSESSLSSIGVISFNDDVKVVQPITPVETEQDKNDLKDKIDQIQADGRTAIGDAAQRALEEIKATGYENNPSVVFLLTDGISNEGIDPTSVIADYQRANVPIYTFGYGADADIWLLQKMASETGGRFYNPETSLDQILQAFQDANQWRNPGGLDIIVESFSLLSGEDRNFPIYLDSEIKTANIVLYCL